MTTFSQNFNNLVTATLQAENQQIKIETNDTNEKIIDMEESAKSQDFFQNNNAIKVKYTTTRIKSRNFLSNIAYVGINKGDYYNKSFVFDVYIAKILNPFSLDRKLADKTKHEMIYMLWRECMTIEFCKFICGEKRFLYLNGKNVLQPKVLQIIAEFIETDEKNYRLLQNNLSAYKNIFQYVYSNVYPEIYCSTEKRGFDLKSNLHIMFKTYNDKVQMRALGKNPNNYENIRKETNIYEQKLINIDDFNDSEEADVKESVEKGKKKRRKVAENNKLLKKQKQKTEENKVKEKDMWEQLSKLNGEFKNIKKAKKEAKKCLRQL